MRQYINFKHWQARAIVIISMLIMFKIAMLLMAGPIHPVYLKLPDLGHQLVPSLHAMFGKAAPYIWWGGSMTEELYGAILVICIALTGFGARWGIAMAVVTLLHSLFWHLTIVPTPPDILWKFPFESGQIPRPDDFWFSGHVANGFLLVLYTHKKAWWIQILAWIYLLFLTFLVLATRTHYSIDIIGALFVTYTVYTLINRYIKWPPQNVKAD